MVAVFLLLTHVVAALGAIVTGSQHEERDVFSLEARSTSPRNIALILDGNLATAAGNALKARANKTDRIGVFDGRGAFSAFGADSKLDGLQGGNLAKGLGLAVDSLNKNGSFSDHIIIVASADNADLVAPLAKAKEKLIKVSYGLLPPQNKARRDLSSRLWRRAENKVQTDVAAAVLGTTGTYAIIDHLNYTDTFAQHVFAYDSFSRAKLPLGLTVYDAHSRYWDHHVDGEETVNITVTAYPGYPTVILREGAKERARGNGTEDKTSTVSVQAEADNSTVEAYVEKPTRVYSIAVSYVSAARMLKPALAPLVLAPLAYLLF